MKEMVPKMRNIIHNIDCTRHFSTPPAIESLLAEFRDLRFEVNDMGLVISR